MADRFEELREEYPHLSDEDILLMMQSEENEQDDTDADEESQEVGIDGPTLTEMGGEGEEGFVPDDVLNKDEINDNASVETTDTSTVTVDNDNAEDGNGYTFEPPADRDFHVSVNGNVGTEDEVVSADTSEEVEETEASQEADEEELEDRTEDAKKEDKQTTYLPSEKEEEVDRSNKETEPQIDPDKPARSPLHTASDRATTDNIDDVVAQNKEDINKRSNDEYGVTPLMCAVNKGNDAMMDALIENGADINMTNNVGETALMYAASNGNMDMIAKLIEHGADTEIKAGKGSAYEGQDFRDVLRDSLEASGKTSEEIEKTMADIEKMIAEKQGKTEEQSKTQALGQTGVGHEDAGAENETPERPDFHDKDNWDRVGVRNNEGGIDAGYRFNLSGMSQEEMNDFIGNLQENGIKGDLRVATIDTDNVKKGDLSYRITDPASVSRLESAVFGENQQEGTEREQPEEEVENTDTQKIEVVKSDKTDEKTDTEDKTDSVPPVQGKEDTLAVSHTSDKTGDVQTPSEQGNTDLPEAEQPKNDGKGDKEEPVKTEEKQSWWSKVKAFASRVFGKKDKDTKIASELETTADANDNKDDKDNSGRQIDYDNEEEVVNTFAQDMGLDNRSNETPTEVKETSISRSDAETVMDYENPLAMAQQTAGILKEQSETDRQPEEKKDGVITSGKNEKGDEWACMTERGEDGSLSMTYSVKKNGQEQESEISFKFDEKGRLKEFNDIEGGKYKRSYDENGRMTGETYTDKDGKVTSKSLEYDEQGRVSKITRSEPGKETESKKVEYSKDGKPQASKQAKGLDAPVIKRQDLLRNEMMNEFSSHLNQVGSNEGAVAEIASLKKGAIR